MIKYYAFTDAVDVNPDRFEYYVEVYLANQVEPSMADLEQQLEMRKEAINAQFRLMGRVKELERALRFYANAQDFYLTDANDEYHDDGTAVARQALGL